MCYNIIIGHIRALFERKKAVHKFLDAEKALEVVLYVSRRTNNLFNIVKTLYYADKYHLERYGQLINGDLYIAMEDGPVPSGAYDLIKLARGDAFQYESKIIEAHPEAALKVVEYKDKDGSKKTFVDPLRDPRLELLSESDIECLDESIERYANMKPTRLWTLVHQEQAYKETERDKPIPIRKIIALDISNGKQVLEYLDS
jgi:hypothetical protein